MKKYNIKVNGVSYEVEVEEVGSAASSAPIQPAPAPASPAAAAKEPAPVPPAPGSGTLCSVCRSEHRNRADAGYNCQNQRQSGRRCEKRRRFPCIGSDENGKRHYLAGGLHDCICKCIAGRLGLHGRYPDYV